MYSAGTSTKMSSSVDARCGTASARKVVLSGALATQAWVGFGGLRGDVGAPSS
jgi:hypothetical protein